jgi:hypothetical protein
MEISLRTYSKLDYTIQLLQLAYALFFVITGVDKFFNFLLPWYQYISPYILSTLTFSAVILSLVAGILELGIGVLCVTKWARLAAYCGSLWLAILALNLITAPQHAYLALFYALASVGALALARLIAIKYRIVQAQ